MRQLNASILIKCLGCSAARIRKRPALNLTATKRDSSAAERIRPRRLLPSQTRHRIIKNILPRSEGRAPNLHFYLLKVLLGCCIRASTCYEKVSQSAKMACLETRENLGSNSQIAVKKYTKIG